MMKILAFCILLSIALSGCSTCLFEVGAIVKIIEMANETFPEPTHEGEIINEQDDGGSTME